MFCVCVLQGGDLFDAITQSVKFGEVESAAMVYDLTKALFYLHSQMVVHRDLKPENVLVTKSFFLQNNNLYWQLAYSSV